LELIESEYHTLLNPGKAQMHGKGRISEAGCTMMRRQLAEELQARPDDEAHKLRITKTDNLLSILCYELRRIDNRYVVVKQAYIELRHFLQGAEAPTLVGARSSLPWWAGIDWLNEKPGSHEGFCALVALAQSRTHGKAISLRRLEALETLQHAPAADLARREKLKRERSFRERQAAEEGGGGGGDSTSVPRRSSAVQALTQQLQSQLSGPDSKPLPAASPPSEDFKDRRKALGERFKLRAQTGKAPASTALAPAPAAASKASDAEAAPEKKEEAAAEEFQANTATEALEEKDEEDKAAAPQAGNSPSSSKKWHWTAISVDNPLLPPVFHSPVPDLSDAQKRELFDLFSRGAAVRVEKVKPGAVYTNDHFQNVADAHAAAAAAAIEQEAEPDSPSSAGTISPTSVVEGTAEFSLEDLKALKMNGELDRNGIQPHRIEAYLKPEEFRLAFNGMNRAEFEKLPAWRQKALKRNAELF